MQTVGGGFVWCQHLASLISFNEGIYRGKEGELPLLKVGLFAFRVPIKRIGGSEDAFSTS